jgi:tetratricopeptide (TPR) repeat protein
MDEFDATVINVKDIEDKSSLLDALDQIERLTQDIGKIRKDTTLSFMIKDDKKKLSEKKYFNKVIEYPESKPGIKKIIDNFISYPEAGALYINEETSALAYAVEALAAGDAEYAETYMDYMVVIDMEHDVINREKIIPKLLKLWKGTDAEYRLRTSFLISDDSELCGSGFWEELDKKKGLYKWFSKDENRKKTAVWFTKCFQKGIRMQPAYLMEMLIEKEAFEFISVVESEILNCPGIDTKTIFGVYSDNGMRLYNNKEYEKAIKYFSKAVNLKPEDRNSYSYRAICYICTSEFENAVKDYTIAISISPDANYYSNRGYSYNRLGEYEKAAVDCTKAIELDQKNANNYQNRGISFINLGEYKKAIEDCTKAIELNPKYSGAYVNRGLCYYNLKDYNNALKDYAKAIEYNPADSTAHLNQGVCYYELSDIENAIKCYSEAIEINPDYKDAYNNRGNCYADLKNYQNALDDYTKAIGIDPGFAIAYRNRAECYEKTGEKEKAKKDYKKAKKLDPKSE